MVLQRGRGAIGRLAEGKAMKTKLTSAADMARSVGIDRKLFGEHF